MYQIQLVDTDNPTKPPLYVALSTPDLMLALEAYKVASNALHGVDKRRKAPMFFPPPPPPPPPKPPVPAGPPPPLPLIVRRDGGGNARAYSTNYQ